MTMGRSRRQIVGLSVLGAGVFATVVVVGASMAPDGTQPKAPTAAVASPSPVASVSPTRMAANLTPAAASPTTSAFVASYNTYARKTAGIMAADVGQINTDMPNPGPTDAVPQAVLTDCAAISGDIETARSKLPTPPNDDHLAGAWQSALTTLANVVLHCDEAQNGGTIQASAIAVLTQSASRQLQVLDQKAHSVNTGLG